MHKHTARWFAAIFVCVFGWSSSPVGQAAYATLQGTVVDESSAMVPGAAITAINIETGARRSAVTTSAGAFVITLLPAGRYRLEAQRDGFATTDIPEVVVNVGNTIDIRVLLTLATGSEAP